MNIRQIASKAGVSVATISRAINPHTQHQVSVETLKHINHLIRKFGYTPNSSARDLNKISTKTIGVIFPYFKGIFYHSYYTNIVAGISDCLLGSEYQFKLLLLKQEKEKWDYYDFKKGERVDGVIVTHWSQFFSSKNVLEKLNVPSIVLNDFTSAMKVFFACGDQVKVGSLAAEHMFSLGHRKIAVFTGLQSSKDSHLRLKGFKSFLALKNISLEPSWIIQADYREDLAYAGVESLFQGKSQPTAIFCLNDQMAFGVLRKLKDMGVACPREVSVMGCDNDTRGELIEVPLTSINIPLYELAFEAAKRLVEHLSSVQNKKPPLRGKVFYSPRLVLRKSTSVVSSRK